MRPTRHLHLVPTTATPLLRDGSTVGREPNVVSAKAVHMTACHAVSIKRLYGPHIAKVAAKHNLREIAVRRSKSGHLSEVNLKLAE